MPDATRTPARKRRRDFGLVVGLAISALAIAGFAWALVAAQELPTGPVDVAWDKTACAHCRMHVGEPGFAAQLQLNTGAVLDFDDPGCLVAWVSGHPAEAVDGAIHGMYFHHRSDDRWLDRAHVGFVAAMPTPMGYGLAAVDKEQPGALPYAEAVARLRAANPTVAGGTR
jgi:hypothetical protein